MAGARPGQLDGLNRSRPRAGRDQAQSRLGGEQHVSSGLAADQQPGIRLQQQDRRVPRRRGQAEDHTGMGQVQHQQRLGDRFHPGADQAATAR